MAEQNDENRLFYFDKKSHVFNVEHLQTVTITGKKRSK